MSHLENKVVFVSGATGGIGTAICKHFASKGARLIAHSRNSHALDSLLADCEGHFHHKIICDVLNPDALQRQAEIVAELQPDIVIHTIGGTLGIRNTDTTDASWKQVFQTNFHAVVELDKPILRFMTKRGHGRVLHLCSSSSLTCKGSAPYGAAKAALAHYSRWQGKQLASQGVIVSGFSPGIVESPNNWAKAKTENPRAYESACSEQPLKRLQSTEEIAISLEFFSSPEAAIYAGTIITADGAI